MPTPPLPSAHMPSHNAAVVIRERIKKKRLFEAQFLFGLLDEDDMPALERQELERELDGLLAVVRDLQLQANKYLAEGEHVLARKMHREIERIAIDVPGLEQGKKFVEAQELAGKESAQTLRQENLAQGVEGSKEEDLQTRRALPGQAFAAQWRQWTSSIQTGFSGLSKGKLILAGSLLALVVISFLFLNMMRREYSDASLKAQAGDGVAIKPLSVRPGESSSVHNADPAGQTQAVAPATTTPNASISIGSLSVEPGSVQ